MKQQQQHENTPQTSTANPFGGQGMTKNLKENFYKFIIYFFFLDIYRKWKN